MPMPHSTPMPPQFAAPATGSSLSSECFCQEERWPLEPNDRVAGKSAFAASDARPAYAWTVASSQARATVANQRCQSIKPTMRGLAESKERHQGLPLSYSLTSDAERGIYSRSNPFQSPVKIAPIIFVWRRVTMARCGVMPVNLYYFFDASTV